MSWRFDLSLFSGVIKTIGDLDRETQATYSLKVRANDGAQSSYAIVNINITDINDEEPVFLQPRYSFDIPEDMVVGTTVGRISATDADSNKNGQVTLSIMSLWGRDKFSLDSQNGVFILMSRLDAEQVRSNYIHCCCFVDKLTLVSVFRYFGVRGKNQNGWHFQLGSQASFLKLDFIFDKLQYFSFKWDSGNSDIKSSLVPPCSLYHIHYFNFFFNLE